MSRIFKVCVLDGKKNPETFAIKPHLKNFDTFKEEIYIRLPELKNKSFKIFYTGKLIK